MLQQAYTPSNTGIASFVHASADYDLAPIGIGSMQEQADRLAEFGRNGDIYVVHAAEGETVIPMEVLDSNPQIKEMLFAQMRDMGMDPERYVVGNELNSINPDTGIPEFFFSSVWKSVKKVFKKAAPIIANLVGNAILPGIGGILASTLVAGYQSGWDLKSMAVAGVTGYAANVLTGGIGGLMNNTGFMAGATQAASAPWNALNDLSGSYAQGIGGMEGAGNAPGASWYDKTLGRTYDPNAEGFDAAGGFEAGANAGEAWAPDPVGAKTCGLYPANCRSGQRLFRCQWPRRFSDARLDSQPRGDVWRFNYPRAVRPLE